MLEEGVRVLRVVTRKAHAAFHFVYDPGVAETLDMRDEGGTSRFLNSKTELRLVCACPGKTTVNICF